MKTFVWNVRFLRSYQVFQILHQHLWDHLFDIIFLSETISSHNQREKLRLQFGFVDKLVVERERYNEGFCLFWTSKVDVSLLSFSKYHIDVRVHSYLQKN
ncbi:hypothetical protein ACOSQ2_026815 [Xanthoceras sorbifolium]